jgi:hypothetical protein
MPKGLKQNDPDFELYKFMPPPLTGNRCRRDKRTKLPDTLVAWDSSRTSTRFWLRLDENMLNDIDAIMTKKLTNTWYNSCPYALPGIQAP